MSAHNCILRCKTGCPSVTQSYTAFQRLSCSRFACYCLGFCVLVAAMLTFSLLQVDQQLQCKVYLVGHSVSLADLVLFATLYRALVRHMDFHNLSIRCILVAAFKRFHSCRQTSPVRRSLTDIPACSDGLISFSTLWIRQVITKG